MRLPRAEQEIMDELEKLIDIPLGKLLDVECLLMELYDCGFRNGQDTRSSSDYNQGYRDGKADGKDEKYEDEGS